MSTSQFLEPMNVILHSKKKTSANVIRVLKWKNYLGLSKSAKRNHKGPYKREAEISESGKEIRQQKQRRGVAGQVRERERDLRIQYYWL